MDYIPSKIFYNGLLSIKSPLELIITDYILYIFCKIICKIYNISALLTAYSQSKPTQVNPGGGG